jgi:hypothetical protein
MKLKTPITIMVRTAFALALCLALATSVTAAEIKRTPQPDGRDIVSISGFIQPGDDQKFIEVAGNPRAITLHSIGGVNQPAANIGSLIRSRGWGTAVRSGAYCYSACALIWFAGVYRHLDRYARLGLHSASTESGERHEEANRKIAIYLEAMGAPQEVIDLQSKADPCCINHIDYTQAEAWGLLNERPVTPPLITTAHTPSSAQVSSSVLQSLPANVQKDIEETRARCQQAVDKVPSVPSGDGGLVTFNVSGKQAVLIDPKLLCDGCYHGVNCSNRDTRDVSIYMLFGNAWKKVLSNENITGDIFVSYVPGIYRPEGQELNALVLDLYVGNKECPTRRAASSSAQSYEARTCVVRWHGAKFTYKPL